METLLPQALHLTWKDKIFSRHYYAIHSNLIKKHTKAIQKIVIDPQKGRRFPLMENGFWEALKSQSQDKLSVIDNIRDRWTTVAGLSHLNSRELVTLLRKNIIPLLAAYQQVIHEIEKESNDWVPEALTVSRLSILAQANENIQRLNALRGEIFEGLLARCGVNIVLQSARHIDDIREAFVVEINQLNILSTPLLRNKIPSGVLDDNLRLTIFDLANQETTSSDTTHYYDTLIKIVQPASGRSEHLLHSKESIEHSMRETANFIETVSAQIPINDFISSLISPKPTIKSIPKTSPSLRYYVNVLWRFRTFGYTIISYMITQWMLGYIFSFLTLAPGLISVGIISSLVLYSIGLFPLWNEIKNSIRHFFTYKKKCEITEALVAIREIQCFMGNDLSQTIIDLCHFDCDFLASKIIFYKKYIANVQKTLQYTHRVERFCCQGTMDAPMQCVSHKLEEQLSEIDRLSAILAKHFSEKIGSEITQLTTDKEQKTITAMMSSKQIAAIQHFVSTYGEELDIKRFSHNANILHKWLENLEKCIFVSQVNNTFKTDFPWGNQMIQCETMNGWNTLLTELLPATCKQQSAIKINQFLKGDIILTGDQFYQYFNILELGSKKSILLKKIQDYVFNTLHSRPREHVSILRDEQIAGIRQWYSDNLEAVKTAEEKMELIFEQYQDERKNILSEYTERQLNDYYEILKGADFYYASQNSNSQQKNLAAKFFHEYDGRTGRAMQFLRFISEEERKSIAADVSKKRLHWLVNNIEKLDFEKLLDQDDIILFSNLWSFEGGFDFSESLKIAVQNKAQEGQDNEKIKQFISRCHKNMLGSPSV